MTQLRENDSVLSISDLSEEEINYICRQITPYRIRAYFKRYPKEFNKIFPGFRVTHLSDESTTMLVRKYIKNDFIASFIRKQLDEWGQKIEEERKTFEEKGESHQRAMLNAIVKSGFAGNVSLFFKITGEYEQFSGEYIALAESAVYLLQNKESGEENRDEALEGGTEERAEESEIEALKGKQKEISDQITELEQALEAEKTAHFEAEKEIVGLSEKNYVLESKLKSTEELFEASEGKVSELQTELEKFRRLSRYADEEDGAERSEEYQFTSICQIFTDYNGNKRCRRLADIENRKVSQFIKNEEEPPYFSNRDKLPLFDGPDTEGLIGVWDWSAVPNNKDVYRDYIHMQYNSSMKYIEVVELTECHSCEEISECLVGNTFSGIIGGKVIFVYRVAENQMSGLLCGMRELESGNGNVRVKKDVYILPQYTIDTGDILEIAGKKIYRYLNLGIPQTVFQVKSPLKVVKDIIIRRATSAVFRQLDLNRKEAQRCQTFLKGLPEKTVYQEIVDAYGCTEKEAEDYIFAFIEQADSYLTERDIDVKTLGAALARNQELIAKCKELLSDEWKTENAEQLFAAQNELEEVRKNVAEGQALCRTYQEQYGEAQGELERIRLEISRQERLARDVEEKIGGRIAAARKDAADFISEMAFVMPNVVQEGNLVSEKDSYAISVTYRKKKYIPGDQITDIDSFEEELADNLSKAGYDDTVAFGMAQMIVFAVCNRLPVVCGSNAERIADCISAMFGEEGTCMLALPIGEARCKELCDFIRQETKASTKVFLVNGIFDGFSLNAFHEIQQCSEEWGHSAILVFPLNGINREMISGYVWNRTIFIDGDIGIKGFESDTLNAFHPDVDFSSEYDAKYNREDYKKKHRLLKHFCGIIDNTALLNYAKYLAATDRTIEPDEMLLLQILLSAKASGKQEELLDIFTSFGFDIKSDKYLKKYL
jgi:hypothetical protein